MDESSLAPDILSRSAISLRNAQKQGYLTKEGGKGLKRNWKKRWFILQGDYLYYYTDDAVTPAPSFRHSPALLFVYVLYRLFNSSVPCSYFPPFSLFPLCPRYPVFFLALFLSVSLRIRPKSRKGLLSSLTTPR